MKVFDIRERSFNFAVEIVKICRYLEKNTEVSRTLLSQLLAAGTSVGANLEEAGAGQSRRDFVHKNAIALKEARESGYWLRLICTAYELPDAVADDVDGLQQQSSEIANIVAKIMINTKK